MVAMKPIVEGMGLDWKGQYDKLRSHPVLATCIRLIPIQMPGDDQERDVICLPLNRINFWLATVQPGRVPSPNFRAAVIAYQVECSDALFNRFFGGRLLTAGGDLDMRAIGGMVKGIVRKSIEDALRERLPDMLSIAIAHDPRVAVGEYISVRELLDDAKALPRGRKSVNRRIGNALRDICLREGGARRALTPGRGYFQSRGQANRCGCTAWRW
jgi:hypothetical protein